MPEGATLSAALAKPHAVEAILALEREPGISGSRLARAMGGSQEITGRVMGAHLESFGIVRSSAKPSPFPGQSQTVYTLTARGGKLARLLREAVTILPDEDE